jgi:hypothetical protein
LLPTLSCLSVGTRPVGRLRHWCSSRYLRISPLHREFHRPLRDPRPAVSRAILRLSRRISPPTYGPACAPFTPSESGQRLPPTYYRGCWHVVSRGLFAGYRQPSLERKGFFPCKRSLRPRGPSSSTRRGWVRLAPIAQDSPLLPPVGVWPVSQCQCGWPSSQTSYPS